MDLAVVDGGKSALRLRLLVGGRRAEGSALGFAHGSSAAADRDRVVGAIAIALTEARARLADDRLADRLPDLAFVGLTGVLGDADERAVLESMLVGLLARRVFVVDDGLLAHAGALGGPGTVAAVGTGVNVTSLAPDGRATVRDAWGPVFGDRGSAYALGLAGIRAAVAHLDGAAPATALTSRLAGLLGGRLPSLETVQRFIRRDDLTAAIASFAQQVLVLAAEGDGVAHSIQLAEATRLAATITAAAVPAQPVTWTGRLLGANPEYLAAVRAACPPDVAERFQPPRGGGLDAGRPLVGAVDDVDHLYYAALRRRAIL